MSDQPSVPSGIFDGKRQPASQPVADATVSQSGANQVREAIKSCNAPNQRIMEQQIRNKKGATLPVAP